MTIDIVVATCERLPLLKRTLESIWDNTRAAHRLIVIDDASAGGNREYLLEMQSKGLVHETMLRKRRAGISANLRAVHGLTRSKLVVYCDDDQLCPKVEPDWLSRLVTEMSSRPKMGLLSLNNPHGNVGGDKRHRLGVDGNVTTCERSGGSYMLIRRSLLPLIVPGDGEKSPVSAMCMTARKLGWENGYLTGTYCWHIGAISARNGWDLTKAIKLLTPVDANTLEPAKEFRK